MNARRKNLMKMGMKRHKMNNIPIRQIGNGYLMGAVPCIQCGIMYIPAGESQGAIRLKIPEILANNYYSRACMDIDSSRSRK